MFLENKICLYSHSVSIVVCTFVSSFGWFWLVLFGLSWFGLVWFGLSWLGLVCFGIVFVFLLEAPLTSYAYKGGVAVPKPLKILALPRRGRGSLTLATIFWWI